MFLTDERCVANKWCISVYRWSAAVQVCSKGWAFLLRLQQPSAAGRDQRSEHSLFVFGLTAEYLFCWVLAFTIIQAKLLKTQQERICSLFKVLFFWRFCRIKPQQVSWWKQIWKAADLRVMLKSHNKVIIQSKHWSCSDSQAAVHGVNW